MTSKPTLAFVSTRFLFPADSGGKIRTSQILRGLKGGAFDIHLLMPADEEESASYEAEIQSVCDELTSWRPAKNNRILDVLRKLAWLFRDEPIPVRSDWSSDAQRTIAEALDESVDLVVFDFPHSAILAPAELPRPAVMFTHNVESEIFLRHMKVAAAGLMRYVWSNQYRKMHAYEKSVLDQFDMTVAVSERDKEYFQREYGISRCETIPTGVDTDFFECVAPCGDKRVVFCGSMDWMANIDAMEWFFEAVWPDIRVRAPGARMDVIGRCPPDHLVSSVARRFPECSFTGFVEDVRDHICGADAFVIPLRVGGGTRIKAFEAMAMGAPVVSTTIGVEGLPLDDGIHFLRADTAESFVETVVSLLENEDQRTSISANARDLVEQKYHYRHAARVFEEICLSTLSPPTGSMHSAPGISEAESDERARHS